MAITNGDSYIAASKQIIPYTKTTSITSIAATRFSIFDRAGNPAAGTLALTTALTGVVPDDSVAGYPVITFSTGTGYLTRVQYSSTVAGRIELWDRLFGINVPLTPAAPTTYTLSGASSYLARTPDGAATGTRLFLEVTAAVAASAATVTVNYTNQAGTAGRTTGASSSLASLTVNRMVEMPLQAGDTGVQSIQSVVVGGVAAATGSVNVIVLRPLWTNRVPLANGGGADGIDMTGMPIVYPTSALFVTCVPDSTSTGVPDLNIEIANG